MEPNQLERLMSTHTNPGTSPEAVSAIDGIRFVVMNENVLGLIRDERPEWVEVLVSSGLKHGPDPLNGPVAIGASDAVRAATLADFEAFRLSPNNYLANAASAEEEPSTTKPAPGRVRR